MCSNDETLLDRSTIPVDDIVDLLDFCLFRFKNSYINRLIFKYNLAM